MGHVVHSVREIQRRTDAAVILVHHTGKPKENGSTMERGSSALRAAADAMIRVERQGDNIRITNDKRKDDAEAEPMLMRLKPVTVGISDGKPITACVVESVGGAAFQREADELAPVRVAALLALSTAGGANIRTADWQQAFHKATKKSNETHNRCRRWLVEHGFVAAVSDKGIYSLTELGRATVMKQSRPSLGASVLQSVSPPLGVTVTADATDDRWDEQEHDSQREWSPDEESAA
jgi:hypothetical protein